VIIVICFLTYVFVIIAVDIYMKEYKRPAITSDNFEMLDYVDNV